MLSDDAVEGDDAVDRSTTVKMGFVNDCRGRPSSVGILARRDRRRPRVRLRSLSVINRLVGLGSVLMAAVALSASWWIPGDSAAPSDRYLLASTAESDLPATLPVRSAPIPISPAGSLGQFNLSSSSYAIARRFVLADETTIDRWYFAINGEGADCVGGRDGYGAGDGGTNLGRIMAVDQNTGLPTQTLASEEVNACDAYERAQREFGLSDRHQAQYIQFAPITLHADTMYAFVLTNVSPDPGDGGGDSSGNHMSANLNFAHVEDMGPHARNTLDPAAPGAAYGVDPRETTMWSDDSGASWRFGDEIGWYGQDDGEGGMWPGGYRVAGGPNLAHGWAYMNWPDEGAASVSYTAPTDGLLVDAGGASSEGDVGVITVTNIDTGASAATKDLGTGLVNSVLDRPVPVARGQTYVVHSEGEVDTGSATPWDHVFDYSTRASVQAVSSCSDCRSETDRPMLYASTVPGAAPGGTQTSNPLPAAILAAALGAAVVIGMLIIRLLRSRP
jgi:hypothetical protein